MDTVWKVKQKIRTLEIADRSKLESLERFLFKENGSLIRIKSANIESVTYTYRDFLGDVALNGTFYVNNHPYKHQTLRQIGLLNVVRNTTIIESLNDDLAIKCLCYLSKSVSDGINILSMREDMFLYNVRGWDRWESLKEVLATGGYI